MAVQGTNPGLPDETALGATALRPQRPPLTAQTLAQLLALVGYPADQAAPAVRDEFPGTTAQAMAAILAVAYPAITEPTLRAALQACGYDAASIDAAVVLLFPAVNFMMFDGAVYVRCNAAADRALSYDFQLCDAAGNALTGLEANPIVVPAGLPPGRSPEARFVGPFTDQQVVTARLRLVRGQTATPYTQPGTSEDAPDRLRLRMLAAPGGVALKVVGSTVVATWRAVAGANGYDLVVQDGTTGNRLATQPPVTVPQPTAARIDAANLEDGVPFQVLVRGRLPRIHGAFCAPVAFTMVGGDLALRFDGAATSAVLGKTIDQQIAYRDAGHSNYLVDLGTTGFTMEASIWPESLDGERPIISLNYVGPGNALAHWKDGDLCVGLSVTDGHVRITALTPEWNAGLPSDVRLVTVTTLASVPAGQWSYISATWEYGGLVQIFIDGQVQQLVAANNHPARDVYNKQFGGLKVCVNTFEPANQRFVFGSRGVRFFRGYLADIKLWKGARPAADIAQDKHGHLTDSQVAAAAAGNLGGYWRLNESRGAVAHDLTPVHNDAAITGPQWGLPGFAAWWPLDSDARDLSGNGRDAQFVGGGAIVAGARGGLGAARLDAGSSISVPRIELARSDFTFAARVNLYDTGRRHILFSDWMPPWQFLIVVDETGAVLANFRRNINSSGSRPDQDLISLVSAKRVPTQQWCHVAVTWSRAARLCTAYVDGAPAGSASPLPEYVDLDLQANTHDHYSIGRKEDSDDPNVDPNAWLEGLIADARVYLRALSPAEVAALSQA